MTLRVGFAAFSLGSFLGSAAVAQQPSAPPASNDSPPAASSPRSFSDPIPTDPSHPDYHASAHRSMMRHAPIQARSYDSNSSSRSSTTGKSQSSRSGFSTGGVGRMAEYYDERTLDVPYNAHPNPVGHFDQGGGPSREEQIESFRAGQQRTSNIQSNINAYGRPYGAFGAGFGYGLGLGGGGGLFTYPY